MKVIQTYVGFRRESERRVIALACSQIARSGRAPFRGPATWRLGNPFDDAHVALGGIAKGFEGELVI